MIEPRKVLLDTLNDFKMSTLDDEFMDGKIDREVVVEWIELLIIYIESTPHLEL